MRGRCRQCAPPVAAAAQRVAAPPAPMRKSARWRRAGAPLEEARPCPVVVPPLGRRGPAQQRSRRRCSAAASSWSPPRRGGSADVPEPWGPDRAGFASDNGDGTSSFVLVGRSDTATATVTVPRGVDVRAAGRLRCSRANPTSGRRRLQPGRHGRSQHGTLPLDPAAPTRRWRSSPGTRDGLVGGGGEGPGGGRNGGGFSGVFLGHRSSRVRPPSWSRVVAVARRPRVTAAQVEAPRCARCAHRCAVGAGGHPGRSGRRGRQPGRRWGRGRGAPGIPPLVPAGAVLAAPAGPSAAASGATPASRAGAVQAAAAASSAVVVAEPGRRGPGGPGGGGPATPTRGRLTGASAVASTRGGDGAVVITFRRPSLPRSSPRWRTTAVLGVPYDSTATVRAVPTARPPVEGQLPPGHRPGRPARRTPCG